MFLFIETVKYVVTFASAGAEKVDGKRRLNAFLHAMEMLGFLCDPRFRIFLLAAAAPVAASPSIGSPVRIIATAETHAMLYPCDCPQAPGGGLPARATALAEERGRGPILLVDAGGFAAGGIYDAYSEGRARDSVRTEAMLCGMGMLRYDAVAVGDEELQYDPRWLTERAERWGVPLVSANCRMSDGRPLGTAFVVVVRDGVRFGITGVCTYERLFPLDSSVHIEPPVEALRRIWPRFIAQSDVQIILSHLGEDQSAALGDSFPECDVIVNGHRKTGTAAVERRGGRMLMQFGFQGKAMSCVDVSLASAKPILTAGGWIEIGEWLRPDSIVETALRRIDVAGELAPPVTFDLYIMSQCPYGLPAARELASLDAPGAVWNVWFIGNVTHDSALVSLHGEDEVRDETLWLAVRALYPDQWRSFVFARGESGESTAALARQMGMDTVALDAWASVRGRTELAMHYRRSERLRISASPTLLINGGAYGGGVTRARLRREWCYRTSARAPLCDSLPACFDDSDCRKPGKLGACVVDSTGQAQCVFRDDAAFGFSVVRPDSSLLHPENAVIRTTLELFPAASIDTVALSSLRGRHLIEVHRPRGLPLFLFDTAVQRAANFPRVLPGLVRTADKFTFKEDPSKLSYFHRRPLAPGAIMVLVDPAFEGAAKVVETALAHAANRPRLQIYPARSNDVAGVQAAYGREESLRWLILAAYFPRQYPAYLRWFAAHAGSSYWIEGLRMAGVSLWRFERRRARAASLAENHQRMLDEMGIGGPVTLLVENREIVPVENQRELARYLGR